MQFVPINDILPLFSRCKKCTYESYAQSIFECCTKNANLNGLNPRAIITQFIRISLRVISASCTLCVVACTCLPILHEYSPFARSSRIGRDVMPRVDRIKDPASALCINIAPRDSRCAMYLCLSVYFADSSRNFDYRELAICQASRLH